MRTVTDLMTLAGRRALLTGAAGHVGLAIGEALVELGATVAVLDRDACACQARADKLANGDAGRAVAVPCDLMDDGATRRVVAAVVDRLGGLDILIHSAAFVGTTDHPGWAVPFGHQTTEAWDAALRVNLTSAFVLAQTALSALSVSGRGVICLVGSMYGLVGPDMHLYDGTSMANPAAYGASKGGLIQLTRHLATLLAPAGLVGHELRLDELADR